MESVLRRVLRAVFGGGSDISSSNPLSMKVEGAYDSLFKFLKVWSPEIIRPIGEINLYAEIPSNSATDTVLQVLSGTGTDTLTTKYIPEHKIAWIESMGLKTEFSDPPDIAWVTTSGKYIRIQRKHYNRSNQAVEAEAKWGGSTSDEMENWRQIAALSEEARYYTGFKKDAKDHLKADLVAIYNLHYWFPNLNGDEYIKLVADAGIFTYTNDVPALYIHGLVFDYDDILNMV
mgnify:CR=1 FL=1